MKTILGLSLISILMVLAGCADVQGRKGTDITIYPVAYQMNVDSNSIDARQLERQMTAFVNNYWSVIATQSVRLTVFNEDGMVLANKVQAQLVHKGVDKDRIVIESRQQESEYDLEMTVLRHVVKTQACRYHNVMDYYAAQDGCTVESARWKSMVNPERAAVQTPSQ